MKFRSLFSVNMRSNAMLCLIFLIISSLQSLVWSVRIQPNEKVKAIWNRQSLFVNCVKDDKQDGVLNWYQNGRHEPIDDNSQAPIYQQHGRNSVKLFLVNVPKRQSGFYECKHTRDNRVLSSDKFELKVYNSIEMEGNKDSYVGTEGDHYSIACISRFDSDRDSTEAQVSWIHNNIRIKDDERHYSVNSRVEQSVLQKTIRSTLNIKRLTKENEGVYTCESVYANPFLTDMKSIDINLRVQFKPRFPENTQKSVWVSDELVGSPVVVNVTCLVNADPIAQFQWYHRGMPIDRSGLRNKYRVFNAENLSTLSLEYENIDRIRNKFHDPINSRQFECKAYNDIGEQRITFDLNVGKLPEQPFLANYSYIDGVLQLTVNDTQVEPPVDIYKLEISDKQHIYFNSTNRIPYSNNTYEITVEVPAGVHPTKLLAHNPVGWSQADPQALLLHINGASALFSHQYMVCALIVSLMSLVTAF